MDARLTALEDKVDRRLQETRPIWEQVLTRLTNVVERLTHVEQELAGVKEGLAKVEARLEKVEDEVDGLGRKVSIFNKDILKIQDRRPTLRIVWIGWTPSTRVRSTKASSRPANGSAPDPDLTSHPTVPTPALKKL
jgi:septal ring factor EnvC (AmiA/AmiB activator)